MKSERDNEIPDELLDRSRRMFVQGVALGGVLLGLGLWERPVWALKSPDSRELTALTGTEFHLTIGPTPVNFTGRNRIATTVNGTVPAPVLHWREGDTVTLHVHNRLPTPSSIHWHGILLPAEMDGVPGISFPGIAPDETFTYRFTVKQSGTYWYHSHTGFQEQTGLYGPLVIQPRTPEPFSYERDYVVMLSDWTDENPLTVFANLKKQSDYYNFRQQTVPGFFREAVHRGFWKTLDERLLWGKMRMSPTDLSDVSAYTYTYLMNGNPPAADWNALFSRGERVRLRFINGSAMTYFDVRIPGLKMRVVAADGQNIEPVTVDEFRIAVAETYDVIVEPSTDQAYCIFAQSMDRTGYARGTLTSDVSLSAPVPPMDPRPVLTMAAMGMGAHGEHGMSMPGMQGEKKKLPSTDMGDMHTMPDMDMSNTGSMSGMDMSAMRKLYVPVEEHAIKRGPEVDNVARMPVERLDDPGVGLRNNGRRVLTYADLHDLTPFYDRREPDREIVLHLTGNMQRYIWGFDGIKFSDAHPIRLNYGERVRIKLINDTMMNHPIHLHGMWSVVENGGGTLSRKHTVNVQPGTYLTYLVSADARGGWAYHCHLLYHMEAGMFREVRVE
ncbi:MAG TPA: copper resistance system multicopper oxidase [Gammaproteobacteria bacterium]|nr:copper resistance system multicopper oxidase [Gammaproteobacteria bacterium]